jgi:hypothetical protein
MAFHVYHRYGACEVNPPQSSFEALYNELADDDDEHPGVSVEHESAWSLGAFSGGLVVWENVEGEEDNARHMRGVPRAEVIRLWRLLAEGDFDAVNAENWQDGYA